VKIEEYRFGYIRIAGEEYRRDLIILPERIIPDWRREQGHRLSLKDLQDVIEYEPEVLVIGTGASGAMKVPNEVREALNSKAIEVIVAKTGEAVKEYNRMREEGRLAVAALHLTC